ncbi:MAG: choice-of-anchor D domain-containing protein [Deltaproteobacteria bacterium]|nr:choice-of-anchor D domain-containing protein [Deltaproteobacteria bacterium]
MMGAIGMAACAGDSGSGGFSDGSAPQIEVSEGANPLVNGGTVGISADRPATIYVGNTGTGTLNLKAISIASSPEGAFSLTSLPMPSDASPIAVEPLGLEHEFAIYFDSSVANAGAASATVTLKTNKNIDGLDTFTFHLSPEAAAPRLQATPKVVEFDTVTADTTATKKVTLLNLGAADLVISSFYLAGNPGYGMALADGQSWGVTQESASQGITLGSPLVIPQGQAVFLDVTYTATGPEAAEGQIVLMTNDPSAADGYVIQMFANVAGPCIEVTPDPLSFGGKLVGQTSTINMTVSSCGDRALTISNVSFLDDAGGMFSVNQAALALLPLDLQPGTSLQLPVSYTPAAVSPLVGGQQQLDAGTLRIESNAYLAEKDVAVTGFGTDGTCPTAVINVTEGEEVTPQTRLHLSASNSTTANGAITGWEWSVIAPPGSVSTFVPSAFVQSPTFEANVVGEYIFRLKVINANGVESCEQASYTVYVTSPEAIHVELLWRTPGDVNEADEGFNAFGESVGSDVDLHFTHPNARGFDLDFNGPDGWFDDRWDAFWSNAHPNWGAAGSNDDPGLDRDDTDGGGPENLNLDVPENGRTYKVGAHYWDDWGYGAAFTTVRVYIYGQLRMEWANVQLINHDMWEVCTIDWPSGAVTKIQQGAGAPLVRHNYWDLLFGL